MLMLYYRDAGCRFANLFRASPPGGLTVTFIINMQATELLLTRSCI